MGVENLRRFWEGKRVLLTGHTGFKGSWTALYLKKLGANVTGVGLPPNTTPSLFELLDLENKVRSFYCDIRHHSKFTDVVKKCDPEIVIHQAAQALVRESYRNPVCTHSTNIMGSVNLLESLRHLDSVKVVIMVTTDKVYENVAAPLGYGENDTLGGHDPYSASKAASEIIISSYRKSFFEQKGVAIATARAGNVIGGGDWSRERLVPDIIRNLNDPKKLTIRSPEAVRPWQHVLEPVNGYLMLAKKIWEEPEYAGPYNFGPDTDDIKSVRDVVEATKFYIPDFDVEYGQEKADFRETDYLRLQISKAQDVLGFRPKWPFDRAIRQTLMWYVGYLANEDASLLCLNDLKAFELE